MTPMLGQLVLPGKVGSSLSIPVFSCQGPRRICLLIVVAENLALFITKVEKFFDFFQIFFLGINKYCRYTPNNAKYQKNSKKTPSSKLMTVLFIEFSPRLNYVVFNWHVISELFIIISVCTHSHFFIVKINAYNYLYLLFIV